MANTLLTGTVIRRPVDRVISKYFFLRTYCQEKALRVGKSGCAALQLDLVPWLYAGHDGTDLAGLVRGSDWKVGLTLSASPSSDRLSPATPAACAKRAETRRQRLM